MDGVALVSLDFAMREAALFAACGFLILGLSDLAVDLIWIGRALRRLIVFRRHEAARADTIAAPEVPGRLAVFIPAWDEGAVIADMLRYTLRTFDHGDYRLYVGCYPNDAATLAAVRSINDLRVRILVGPAGIM